MKILTHPLCIPAWTKCWPESEHSASYFHVISGYITGWQPV